MMSAAKIFVFVITVIVIVGAGLYTWFKLNRYNDTDTHEWYNDL